MQILDPYNNRGESSLLDPFGRAITYLRVSVTDRCDFRCVYCMSENMSFLPKADLLNLEELDRLCSAFVARGVRKAETAGQLRTLPSRKPRSRIDRICRASCNVYTRKCPSNCRPQRAPEGRPSTDRDRLHAWGGRTRTHKCQFGLSI